MQQQTLAQMIKSKYPGSYDDIPDYDLEEQILVKYPDYKDIPRTPKQNEAGFFSRVGEGLTGLKNFGADLIDSRSPLELGGKLFSGIFSPFGELTTDRPNKNFADDLAENVARFGIGMVGGNYDAIDQDLQGGNLSALAGDLVLPLGMAAIGNRISKRAPEITVQKQAPPVTKTPISNPAKLIAEKSVVPDRTFIADQAGKVGEVKAPLTQDFFARENVAPLATSVSPFDMPSRRLTNEVVDLPSLDTSKGFFEPISKYDELAKNRPVSGDTRLGFAPESSPETLGYPLDVIPNRVRPRSMQTEMFARTKVDEPIAKIEPKKVELDTSTIKDPKSVKDLIDSAPEMDYELPSAVKVARSKVPEVAKIAGDSPKILDDALTSKNKVVQQTALDYAAEVDRLGPLSTLGTRLKSLGDSGVELYRRGARFAQQERFFLRDWAEPYRQSIMKLSKPEMENFGNYVEGKLPIENERVANAVNAWKRAEELAGTNAESTGMMIELANGEKVPFTRIQSGYWPRRLKESELANLPSKIDQMVADGMTREEAHQVMKSAKKYGELVLPQQHQRLSKRFEYDTHAKSGLIHLESMAKSVARTKEFGRYDVAKGGNFGVHDLIEETSNPELARDIIKRVIGRDQNLNKQLDQTVRVARTAVSWARLQNYGLSSIIGNQLPNMLRATGKEYLKSLGTFIGKNKAITDHSAAMIDISHGIFEQTKKLNPMKVYGGQIAENVVRGQAAGIGQGLAKSYFRELKKNPSNAAAKKQLFELVLEPVDKLLEQKALSSDQLRMAAARNAEISQGLTNPLNMPGFMSNPVDSAGNAMLQLGLIFKKQAGIQTKMIKDSMKTNPIKTTALLLGMSQLAGGTIGAIKSTVTGTARGIIGGKPIGESIENEYAHRADWIKSRITGSDDELLNRSIDRALQSWAFGVGGDLLYLALDSKAMSEYVGGPAFGLAGDILGNMFNPTQLGREATKMLPIPGGIGTAIQKEILPTRNQK